MFTSSATWCATGVSRSRRSARDRLDPHLQREVRDDRGEVAVAGALAVAVDRALHLDRAAAHAGERVGHAGAGVVVEVHRDADVAAEVVDDLARRSARPRAGSVPPFVSHSTSRVAPACGRALEHAQAELGVAPVAVEEVLGVEEHARARRRAGTRPSRRPSPRPRRAWSERLESRGSPTTCRRCTPSTCRRRAGGAACRRSRPCPSPGASSRTRPACSCRATAPTARAGRTRRPSGWRPASRPR